MKRFIDVYRALGRARYLFVMVALAACTTASGEVVRIGYIGPLTGDAASYGADTLNAVRMKVEELNAAGGIGGKRIELVAEDSRCNGADAASATQKLVNVDKVVAIVGGQCSSETLAAAKIIEPAKVLLVSPVSSAPDIADAGDFVFRVYPSDAHKGKVMAKLMSENGLKKVAIITENTDYCQGIRRSVKGSLGAGMTAVFDEQVDQSTKDYRSLVTRLKGLEFDVLLVNGQSDATNGEMVKQARDLGITQQIYGTDTSDSTNMVPIAGKEAMEGLILVNTSSKLGEGGADSFASKFRKAYGEPKSNLSFATLAYDAMGVVAEAVGKAGTSGEALRDYLYDLDGYDGAAGKISFDEKGEVIGVGYAVKTFKDGRIEELELVPAE